MTELSIDAMRKRVAELEELGTPEHPEPGEDAFTGLDQDEANELEQLRRLLAEGRGR